jgi:hypothetical protein
MGTAMFTALHRDEFLFSADSVDAMLAFVLDCIDPSMLEDAVVWQGGLVVAVVLFTGRIIRLDALPVPSPEVPADPARLDEAAA